MSDRVPVSLFTVGDYYEDLHPDPGEFLVFTVDGGPATTILTQALTGDGFLSNIAAPTERGHGAAA